MRDDVKITVDLEAEDTLAVRLKSLRCAGAEGECPVRVKCSNARPARVLDVAALASKGALSLLEVDGVSNAVLLRTPKPE